MVSSYVFLFNNNNLWIIVMQHPTKLQLHGHLPNISKTTQIRQTRHTGYCWRSKNELTSNVFLQTPLHGCASVGQPTRIYRQQLCMDTGCSLEDLPEVMGHRDEWWERERESGKSMLAAWHVDDESFSYILSSIPFKHQQFIHDHIVLSNYSYNIIC